MKRLCELFPGAPDIPIEYLSQDSRDMKPNGMFFCVKGLHFDGHRYIDDAISNGAVCIVHSDPIEDRRHDVVYITADDVLDVLNAVADQFYDSPSSRLKVVGVTGTNGKSTVSYITYQLLNRLGLICGYIGTISIQYNNQNFPSPFTTPESIYLHRTLADMVKSDVKAVAMEVSSNGLDLKRTASVDFDVAVFTNLTHEHLDFHGTMEGYLEAKKKLFLQMGNKGVAVLNKDDSYFDEFLSVSRCQVMTYSLYQEADLAAKDITMTAQRTKFTLLYQGMSYPVETNLLAQFNVSNLLAAIGAVLALGYQIEDILKHVNDFEQVAGRIEHIDEGQPFDVIVDYAHTPDGFEKIYTFARSITPANRKIITVFGSAGLRDTKKRPILGKISDEFCDIIILTEEDPRTEDAKLIADEIKAGIKNKRTVFIESREEAIQQAIDLADEGDTVLILGKGDEDFLDKKHGEVYYPGDHVVARDALKARYSDEERGEEE